MPKNLTWPWPGLGTRFIAGTWITALTALVVLNIVLELRWSTSALLFMTWIVPMGVPLLLGWGAGAALSTHDMLYAGDDDDGGRA